MQTQITITDEELNIKLVSSYLDFQQVLIISPMIPALNAQQREELLKLIDESHQINARKQEADDTYNEGLAELNKEYLKKIDQLVVDEANYARKEYEKLGATNDAQQLSALENQMNDI